MSYYAPSHDRRALPGLFRGLTIALLLSLPTQTLHAQRLQFRYLTPDDGLAASWVRSIAQDRRGFMWFATSRGLNRYDGITLRTYRHDDGDSTSLSAGGVNALTVDRAGTLWIATDSALSRYDAGRDAFVNYRIGRGALVQNLAVGDNGVVWIGTSRGAVRYDTTSRRATELGPGTALATSSIEATLRDRDGLLWFGTQGEGLFRVHPSTAHVTPFTHRPTVATSLPAMDIREIAQDASGMLWVGFFDGGLAQFDPRRGIVARRFVHRPGDPSSLSAKTVFSILPARSGRALWIAMENGGLDHLDLASGTITHNIADPSDESGLNNNSAWAVFEDAGGIIWVGTFNGGVNISKPNGEAIRRYHALAGDPTSLGGNSVLNFEEDATGNLWIATDGGGLNRFDRASRRFARFTTQTTNLASNAVLDVAADRDGRVWIATWAGGIARFDPTARRFDAAAGSIAAVSAGSYFSVHVDRAGIVWAGSWRDGLVRYDPRLAQLTRISTVDSGTDFLIRDIAETRSGELLLSTEGGGLLVFDPATRKKTRYAATGAVKLASSSVFMAVETEPGVVWIATGAGLDRLDRRANTVTHLTMSDGLPSNTVQGVAADRVGNLWITTDRGVARFDPKTRALKRFTVADGLQGSEFLAGSAFTARDGTIYLGGTKGFNAIQPGALLENRRPPAAALTGFQLFNRPVAIGAPNSPLTRAITELDELLLRHDQSVFTLEYAALDYAAPAKNSYAYKLEGFDKEWNEVGQQRSASYTNLAPGRYTFRLRAANNDGVWNQKALALPIVITPPFWATWWFRATIVVLGAAGIWSLFASARRRRQYLESMNKRLAAAAERDRASQQHLERNAEEILDAMERFASGDLTVTLHADGDDVMMRLRSGVNATIDQIRAMVLQVHEVLDATAAASEEIQASTEELTRAAEEQLTQTTHVSGVAEHLAGGMRDNASRIASAAQMAQRSVTGAQSGAIVVRQGFAGVQEIVESITRAATTVEQLGRSSAKIGSITQVIEGVADQTNLLAVNSAIEAARAGHAGRGFAVVAQEIRTLAESTAASTEAIRRLLVNNERDAQAAVAAMQKAATRASDQSLVIEATSALDAIVASAEQTLNFIRQVRETSDAQTTGATTISENVEIIAQVTHSAASGTQAIARSIEDLNAHIVDLQRRVDQFHLAGSDSPTLANEPSRALPVSPESGKVLA
jgi:methyl-accepting chemotaxis protein/ligand-binding sensor domain-containing protein